MTDRASAVRLFAPDHPSLANTLRAKLMHRRGELALQLISSMDWPDHCKRVGVMSGLNEAINMCEFVEKELNGD